MCKHTVGWSCCSISLSFLCQIFHLLSSCFLFFRRLSTPLLHILPATGMLARMALSRGIVAHRISKNVTLYTNELASPASGPHTQTSEDHKPLTLMLPWLGSRPKSVAKYCEIYYRTGFDVLVVESEVWAIKSLTKRFIRNALYTDNDHRQSLLYVKIKVTS